MKGLENRSLDRGIEIMEVLARSGPSTLADLNRESGIPKSTIRRLLGTLQDRQIVRRSFADQKYRINIRLPMSTDNSLPVGNALLMDIAMPTLVELTGKVLWPSDLQLIENTRMRIVDSTRPLSPFHLNRGIVNRQLNIFGSATGRACLAFLKDEKIRNLISDTKNDSIWGIARLGLSENAYFKTVEETRKSGYGVRLAISLGETKLDDGLAAIAFPVFHHNIPIGAINLLFPREFQNPHHFADEYLEPLKKAADSISKDLDRYFT